MAQSKMNDLAGKFGKGGPPGLGLGLKVLAVGGALAYGLANSVYTGNLPENPVSDHSAQSAEHNLNLFAGNHFERFHNERRLLRCSAKNDEIISRNENCGSKFVSE